MNPCSTTVPIMILTGCSMAHRTDGCGPKPTAAGNAVGSSCGASRRSAPSSGTHSWTACCWRRLARKSYWTDPYTENPCNLGRLRCPLPNLRCRAN